MVSSLLHLHNLREGGRQVLVSVGNCNLCCSCWRCLAARCSLRNKSSRCCSVWSCTEQPLLLPCQAASHTLASGSPRVRPAGSGSQAPQCSSSCRLFWAWLMGKPGIGMSLQALCHQPLAFPGLYLRGCDGTLRLQSNCLLSLPSTLWRRLCAEPPVLGCPAKRDVVAFPCASLSCRPLLCASLLQNWWLRNGKRINHFVKHSEMFSKDFEHTFNGNKAF